MHSSSFLCGSIEVDCYRASYLLYLTCRQRGILRTPLGKRDEKGRWGLETLSHALVGYLLVEGARSGLRLGQKVSIGYFAALY